MTITVMKVEDVLKMPSVDSAGNAYNHIGDTTGYPTDPTDPNATVATTIVRKPVRGEYYKKLRDAIIHDGINKVPVHVATGKIMRDSYSSDIPESWENVNVLGNGHHRMRILSDLGFPYILTTDTKNKSGYQGEHSSRQTNALFQPTRKEPTMTALNKGHFGFAVEINTGTGEGWEIAQGPIPRSDARRLAGWYRTHVDYVKQPKFRVRVVPTGAPKEELVNG